MLKEVYGLILLGLFFFFSRDGSMFFIDKDEILEMWVDYFNNVLYGFLFINDVVIN